MRDFSSLRSGAAAIRLRTARRSTLRRQLLAEGRRSSDLREAGSVGGLIAALLLFVGALSAGAAVLVGRSLDYGRRVEAREELRLRLRRAVDAEIALLAADSSPESDGPRDSAWSARRAEEEGTVLRIEELSSRPNPNLASPDFLERGDMRSLLAPGASPASLVRHRQEKGLSTELSQYRAFLGENHIDCWSGFGWASASVADPDSLRELYRAASGSEDAAEAFGHRLASARATIQGRRALATGKGLKELLGSSGACVYPVICAEAPHNVNFVTPDFLRAILSYPPLGLADPAAAAKALLSAREVRDLSEPELAALVADFPRSRAPESEGRRKELREDPLLYLGVRSWFWRIRAEGGGAALQSVVAAIPLGIEDALCDATVHSRRRIVVVETRFEP